MTAGAQPAVPLAREFPEWDIACGLDICTAYWCSPDGCSRRYIVARSAAELLERLREAVRQG